MKCPDCQTENLKTAYCCVRCGKVLHSMKVVTFTTVCLIISALLQFIVIVTAVVLLRTGFIAAYYLKKGDPQTASRIISKYSEAEDSSVFQRQLEKSIQSEAAKYDSGEKPIQEVIDRLTKYSFYGDNSRTIIDDVVQKLQAEQKYDKLFINALEYVKDSKYKKAVEIRQSMLNSYPDRSESIEDRFLEIDQNAITAVESQLKELSENKNSNPNSYPKMNSQYRSLSDNLECILENAMTDQIKEKAYSMLESLYKEWLGYNEKNQKFFEENGAFEIAEKYDAFCSGGKTLEEVNRKCSEYYNALINESKSPLVYKALFENQKRVDRYSKLLNNDEYQTLKETAMNKWKTEIKEETIALTNQYREENGKSKLEQRPELDQLSETLLNSLDKWDDSDFVSDRISESVDEWTYARRIIYEDCDSVADSVKSSIQEDDEYILWNDASQIGIGIRFHKNDTLFDCVMVLLY